MVGCNWYRAVLPHWHEVKTELSILVKCYVMLMTDYEEVLAGDVIERAKSQFSNKTD